MQKANSKESNVSTQLVYALETSLHRYKTNGTFDALDIKSLDEAIMNYMLHGPAKEDFDE